MSKGKMHYKLAGLAPKRGTPTMVFLPGFPDEADSFDALASRFASTHTLIQTCFPDYEIKSRSLGGGKLRQMWGYSFEQICVMVMQVVEEVSAEEKITLVAHDWGAFTAYMIANSYPHKIERMVTLDVGLVASKRVSLAAAWNMVIIASYQLWLIVAFLLSQLLSAALGDIFMGIYPWKWFGPTPDEYKIPRRIREIHSWMCYPCKKRDHTRMATSFTHSSLTPHFSLAPPS